jgi:hypothetical protein
VQHDNWTITGNTVTNNNKLPDGSIWYTGTDCDCFGFQNISNTTISGNDLSGNCELERVDSNKINVSSWHWNNDLEICDDNLYVSNSDLYRKIHYDVFDNIVEDVLKIGSSLLPEFLVIKLAFGSVQDLFDFNDIAFKISWSSITAIFNSLNTQIRISTHLCWALKGR